MPTTISEALAEQLRGTDQRALDRLKKQAAHYHRPQGWLFIPDLDNPEGEPLAAVRVEALSDDKLVQLNADCMPKPDPNTGTIPPGSYFNGSRYRTMVILEATLPEYRASFWGNPELREAYGVQRQQDLVERLLPGYFKWTAVQMIDALGGRQWEMPTVEKAAQDLGNGFAPEEPSGFSIVSTSAVD